jgi:hypothetical protein
MTRGAGWQPAPPRVQLLRREQPCPRSTVAASNAYGYFGAFRGTVTVAVAGVLLPAQSVTK